MDYTNLSTGEVKLIEKNKDLIAQSYDNNPLIFLEVMAGQRAPFATKSCHGLHQANEDTSSFTEKGLDDLTDFDFASALFVEMPEVIKALSARTLSQYDRSEMRRVQSVVKHLKHKLQDEEPTVIIGDYVEEAYITRIRELGIDGLLNFES
jgi:hypothetical protein